MEFNTEFLQFSSLWTSIYRLQVQMSVWLEIPRHRSDGSHKASGRTTVRLAFQISQKFFLELSRVRMVLPCRPYGRTLAVIPKKFPRMTKNTLVLILVLNYIKYI